ncbi:MAG: hypothetical protein H6815_09210 [Phycisphaeraceae bacterium]|nr:hypothetical protein [Phycisphaerales bacterium]MCB9860616.1 hypothetical protein [Phycisphaeraceae bacterium]
METFDQNAVFVLVVGLTVLVVLNALAVNVCNTHRVHDMKMRVAKLRIKYGVYLAKLGTGESEPAGFILIGGEDDDKPITVQEKRPQSKAA